MPGDFTCPAGAIPPDHYAVGKEYFSFACVFPGIIVTRLNVYLRMFIPSGLGRCVILAIILTIVSGMLLAAGIFLAGCAVVVKVRQFRGDSRDDSKVAGSPSVS